MNRSPVFLPCPRCGAPRAIPAGCTMPGQWRCWKCRQVPVKPLAVVLALFLCVALRAQSAAPTIAEAQVAAVAATAETPVALPTFVGGGVAFNQLSTPRVTGWVGGFYPVATSAGVYLSTVADVLPVKQTDSATGRSFIAFKTSLRQGAHKKVGTWGKLSVLVGGDAGAGFSQASPSGVNVSFDGSFTATLVYAISSHVAIVAPLRMLWLGEAKSWNAVPEFGFAFRP